MTDSLLLVQVTIIALLIWNGIMLTFQTWILRALLPEIKKISGMSERGAKIIGGVFGFGKKD